MPYWPKRAYLVAFLVALLVAVAPTTTVGSSHVDLTVSPSIDTPDRNESFQGSTYTLTELGRVSPGQPVDVSVGVDDDTDYDVLVYDADRQIEQQDSGTGEATFSFPTEDLEPGTYIVALQIDGSVEDVEPVVVSRYDVSTDAPAEATEGSTVDVSATLAGTDSEELPERVQVVVGDSDDSLRATLSHDSGSTYSASVDVSSLSTGSYSLYVIAEGTEEIYDGQNEILGVSDTQSFQVTDGTTDDAESSDPGDDEATDENDAAATEGTATATSTGTPTTTDDSVITPSSDATTTEPPETSGADRFMGVILVLLALVGAGVVAWRRA